MSEAKPLPSGSAGITINDHDEHQAALDEFQKLMDQVLEPGSAGEARFLALADAIEAYEGIHFPIPAPADSSQQA